MADPFVGEIRTISFDFAPKGWALCNGQLLPIAHNQALFSLLGTNFGGDGSQTFGVPNLPGCVAVNPGAAIQDYPIVSYGEEGGSISVTMNIQTMLTHTHNVTVGPSSTPAPSIQPTLVLSAGSGSSTLPATPGSLLACAPSTNSGAGILTNMDVNPEPLYGVIANLAAPLTPSLEISSTGVASPISIMPAYLVVNFMIALTGIYPSHN